jgi:chromosome partitioning protein
MDLAALIDTVKEAVTPVGTPHRVAVTKVDTRSLREAIEAQILFTVGNSCYVMPYYPYLKHKAHERAALDGVALLNGGGKTQVGSGV